MIPAASNSVFFALGVGSQLLYIDPDNDLVIVVRWIEKDSIDGFVERVLASLSVS
jgi:CubicO group peptidase (beta-lactamase class C family)